MQTRGSNLNSLYNHLQRVAPDKADAALAAFPADIRAELGNCKSAGWYSTEHFAALNIAIADLGSTPAEKDAQVVEAGVSLANDGLNSFMRLILRMLTPNLFARKIPDFWKRDNKFGSMEALEIATEKGLVRIEVKGIESVPYMGPLGRGFLSTILAAVLNKPVHAEEESSVGELPAPSEMVYRMTWDV